ncbi:MAG: DUF1801 domain-containing protein [Tabrizicola sp.]|uniref:DUF1801 domain-containing protein n=1 Tax=Tabrizicola sp. TaxID=2005166 RepID=UPI002AB912E1|nr:DUF1801 domain-containing protein [Tabrizicola sp.]MDZ4087050.1 DUF1801 domain-containing protein [Tabrizicola sp.]
MAEPKTKSAPLDREVWLKGVKPGRRAEAAQVLALFAGVTGWEPRLWGPSMVGFGRYVYRYESGHGGESLAVGFSPRKAELSLYGLIGGAKAEALMARLGPHRAGTGCLYLKRLAAVDEGVLRALIQAGLEELGARWEIHPV